MAVARAAARGELAHGHAHRTHRAAARSLCCAGVLLCRVVFALLVNFMRELTRTHYAPTDISPPPRTSAPHRGPMRWTAPRSARRAIPRQAAADPGAPGCGDGEGTAVARAARAARAAAAAAQAAHRAAEGGGGEGGSGSEVRRGGPRLDLYAAFAARGGCHD